MSPRTDFRDYQGHVFVAYVAVPFAAVAIQKPKKGAETAPLLATIHYQLATKSVVPLVL
jgi:hypothetical protein